MGGVYHGLEWVINAVLLGKKKGEMNALLSKKKPFLEASGKLSQRAL